MPVDLIESRLEKIISELTEKGVIYYGVGGALGFDTIAALTVIKLREVYPQIKLILVLPCKEQTKGWKQSDKDMYNYILSKANKVVYTSEHYFSGCMQKRNRHLVENSEYCICYKERGSGGTAYTVNYAIESGIQVINII